MKKISGDIIFEVTRRCNMICLHCLRGDAQNVDMSMETVDKALDQIEYMTSITFSGGEPGLNVGIMKYILDGCKKRNIPIYGFFVATNGGATTPEFIMFMLQLYLYVVQCGGEPEMMTLALSSDEFHEELEDDEMLLLKGLSFFSEDAKKTDFRKSPLINEGRAKQLNTSYKKRELCHYDPTIEVDDNTVMVVEGYIYFCANGIVRTECDASYDNTDYDICTVDDNIADVLMQFCEDVA